MNTSKYNLLLFKRRLYLLNLFFKKHEIEERFVKNFHQPHQVAWRDKYSISGKTITQYIVHIITSSDVLINFRGFFLYVFQWARTTEGQTFWARIDGEWCKFLKTRGYETY